MAGALKFYPQVAGWALRFAVSTCAKSATQSLSEFIAPCSINLVLLFRGQRLSDAELVAFSRRFGDLDFAPVQETGRRFVEGMPEIYVVSNVVKGGEPIGSLGAGEASWHTDMSYLDDPPMASLLYALEVPPAVAIRNSSTCIPSMRHCRPASNSELRG